MPSAVVAAQSVARLIVIDTAREYDSRRARQLCAGLYAGEIVLFDRGYSELAYFWELTERGVSFVTRAKDNRACRVKKRLSRGQIRGC